MKRYSLILGIIVFLSMSLFLNCGGDSSKKTNIGVVLPLTGKMSFYGNEVKDALSIVENQENNKMVKFIYEDNQSLASNSVTVFNKFALDNTIPLVISCNSPLSIPLRPLAEKNNKVLLALVTGARDFASFNKWCFRDAINQDQEGVALAKYIINKTDKKSGVTFVVNDDYGLGGATAFRDEFTNLGGNIVAEETFEMNQRNMRNSIIKLLGHKPGFLYLVGREQTIISVISQAREIDRNLLIISSDAFDSPTVIEGLKENAVGIIYASYYNDLGSEEAKSFLKAFKSKYNRDPGIYAIDAYVAGKYLLYLIDRAGNKSEALRQSFSQMEFDSAIKGNLKVSDKRDVISPIAIYQMTEDLNKKVIDVVK